MRQSRLVTALSSQNHEIVSGSPELLSKASYRETHVFCYEIYDGVLFLFVLIGFMFECERKWMVFVALFTEVKSDNLCLCGLEKDTAFLANSQ